MLIKYLLLLIITLLLHSCSPKFNPSKEYGELQKVNLKEFEGKWELINNDSIIEYKTISIKISNDTIFKYSSTKYTYKDSFYENFDTIKFKLNDNHLSHRYFKLIPFIFIYFVHIDERNEYSITNKGILVERDFEDKFGMIFIIPAGRTFENYYYYKKVN